MKIRRLLPSDVFQVKRLGNLSFDDQWTEDSFLHFLRHQASFSYGAFVDEELVSYFIALLVEGDLDVASVATAPRFRSRGIASVLVESVLERSQVKKAFLEVGVDNPKAISLYEKVGFKAKYVRPKYYAGRKDAWVMHFEKH